MLGNCVGASGDGCIVRSSPSSLERATLPKPMGRNRELSWLSSCGRLTARSHQNRTTQHSCVQPAFDIDIARHRGNPHVKAASCNRGRATRELNQYRQLQTKPIPERPLINQADLRCVCLTVHHQARREDHLSNRSDALANSTLTRCGS